MPSELAVYRPGKKPKAQSIAGANAVANTIALANSTAIESRSTMRLT